MCSPRSSTRARMRDAALVRRKYSPTPVHDTAPSPPIAYVPAPMIGASPTRPARLRRVPPVDVAATISPSRSRTTAPTVPVDGSAAPTSSQGTKYEASTVANPSRVISVSASEATINTCWVCSMMYLATSIGFFGVRTAAIAPAARSLPRMIEASSSTYPLSFGEDPFPA